ncbi:MAG: TIR domain-containing protein [Bacilli bacterium]|nr:TIR domain-containing protein [Bacilli bacterium]
MERHKVFISYYHKDQSYKDLICDVWNSNQELFDDYSVGFGDIDDTNKSDETIRKIIRDEYIADATVLLLLCGPETKTRKYIDWELHAAMYNTENNPKMGIVVINLPNSRNGVRAPTDREKEIVAPNSNWTSFDTRKEFEERYPSAPSRIIDSLYKCHSDITFVDWSTINNNHLLLKELIDYAFKRKDEIEYDTSATLRRKNS